MYFSTPINISFFLLIFFLVGTRNNYSRQSSRRAAWEPPRQTASNQRRTGRISGIRKQLYRKFGYREIVATLNTLPIKEHSECPWEFVWKGRPSYHLWNSKHAATNRRVSIKWTIAEWSHTTFCTKFNSDFKIHSDGFPLLIWSLSFRLSSKRA